ncbi:MAG: MFS transporter [Bacteroidales bacterium]|nr:MFS transporter [Bacteroidales bacterium]MBN2757893.1 MFS transporter [Bacteroidales bacterium]
MADIKKLSQPKELYILFFTEMWERFNYYGMRALLVLYMVYDLFVNKRGFGDTQAYAIYAAYGSLVYATPYIGGIIADKFLGYKKSIIFGGIIMAAGEFLMMVHSEFTFYIALSLIIVGNGFFKPNISSIVGGLYDDDDPRRDGGFTIFYMGINLGAAIAPILTALVMDIFGFQYAFGLAGLGMIAGLITFIKGKAKLGDNGNPPSIELLQRKVLGLLKTEYVIYTASFLVVPIFMLLLFYYKVMEVIFPMFGIFVLATLIYNAIKLPKVERERLFVVIILVLFSVMFWAFFEQAGSSLTLFTELNIDRWVGNWQVPTPLFQSVNAFFIILLGPVFAATWIRLNSIGKEPSTPLKFAIGLLFIGLGFGSLVWGASFAQNGLVPIVFIVLIYFLNTVGELSLSPVGLSMVTKLSPKKIVGMVMGSWMLAVAFAQFFGGMIAQYTSTDEYMEKSINYTPKLGAKGNDKIIFRAFDSEGNKSEPIELNIELIKDVKLIGNDFTAETFYVRKSIKPNESIDLNLRIKNLDPLGDLTKIKINKEPVNGTIKVEGDNLTYKPNADFTGTDTICYNMQELVNGEEIQTVKIILTVDNQKNHTPLAMVKNISAKVWQKPWYTNSAMKINVLDYIQDADGDNLDIEIIENPDIKKATANVQSNLNTFVGPNKTIHIYSAVFKMLAITAIATALLLLMLVPILKKWMHGIN